MRNTVVWGCVAPNFDSHLSSCKDFIGFHRLPFHCNTFSLTLKGGEISLVTWTRSFTLKVMKKKVFWNYAPSTCNFSWHYSNIERCSSRPANLGYFYHRDCRGCSSFQSGTLDIIQMQLHAGDVRYFQTICTVQVLSKKLLTGILHWKYVNPQDCWVKQYWA